MTPAPILARLVIAGAACQITWKEKEYFSDRGGVVMRAVDKKD